MSIGSVKEKVSAAIAAGSKSGAKVTLDEARAIVTEAGRRDGGRAQDPDGRRARHRRLADPLTP